MKDRKAYKVGVLEITSTKQIKKIMKTVKFLVSVNRI